MEPKNSTKGKGFSKKARQKEIDGTQKPNPDTKRHSVAPTRELNAKRHLGAQGQEAWDEIRLPGLQRKYGEQHGSSAPKDAAPTDGQKHTRTAISNSTQYTVQDGFTCLSYMGDTSVKSRQPFKINIPEHHGNPWEPQGRWDQLQFQSPDDGKSSSPPKKMP